MYATHLSRTGVLRRMCLVIGIVLQLIFLVVIGHLVVDIWLDLFVIDLVDSLVIDLRPRNIRSFRWRR